MNLLVLAIHALLALFSPRTQDLAEGARRMAPDYLTAETSNDHALAAVIAGSMHNVDPSLLLSISWHESRFSGTEVTPEAGGKFSCGPMTPVPTYSRAACARATSTLLGGYLTGAQHMRTWLDACHGNARCAELGYAGGGRLIKLCAERTVRACYTPQVFEARAARIRKVPAS